MEKQKQRQRKKKDRTRQPVLDRQIPDAPTLEEFECLLGESPTNYPRGEGVENMESELHSAAIDTEIYEKQVAENAVYETEYSLYIETEESVDEVDNTPTIIEHINQENQQVDQVSIAVSNIQLVDITPTAPIFENNIAHSSEQPMHNIPLINKVNCKEQPKKDVSTISEKIDKVSSSIKEIKPFTESQLATLYNNQELMQIDAFIIEFTEGQLKSNIKQHHRLYDLLMSYLRVRNHLAVNSIELETLKKNYRETQKQLWCLSKTSVTESGECQDGNPVSATHEYSVAFFNQQTLVSLSRNLSTIKELLHNTQALYCYEAEVLKLQIEHYIQRVCGSCKEFTNLSNNTPVNLLPIPAFSQTIPQLVELRTCISILFTFQRKILKDEKFVTDTREWLSKLVAILLRVATWQDHLFLLNHILRCPGGITNWARSYIQIPTPSRVSGLSTSPINDPYLDHMIAVLAVILLPIKEREKFLEQVQISLKDTGNNPCDTVWVMLDEDGEEDEDVSNLGANLFESDLISLLHQIPLNKLFEQILFIQNENDKYHQDKAAITDHHMLKIFAFSTVLVRILKHGLKTYESPRYRQLAKRLSALIKDIVYYVSDLWELFDKNQLMDKNAIVKLQLEYDCFFLKATMCIFSSRRLGAWQYLAAIPYNIVSSETLWQIFYILHTDNSSTESLVSNISISNWEEELSCPRIRKQFEDKLSKMPGDESYFLLTTFANMAMARTILKDYNFIRETTLDLFQIGFLSEKTQESCSKDARSLLSNITSKHPMLLSDILLELKNNFEFVGKLSLYLFTELKLERWIPESQDIEIISNWLYNYPLASTESHLARLILDHLNWNFNDDKSLFLPITLHRHIALLIVKSTMKFIPDLQTQTSSLLTEGIKQVSSMVRPQSSEQIFSMWTWEMICKLRLHKLDQSTEECQVFIRNITEVLSEVPDLESDSSLEILVSGVKKKQPIACYTAVVMTLWGHSIPLICLNAFHLLEILMRHYKYEQILLVLHNIVPLFFFCPDALFKTNKFIKLVMSLITADRTYMKIAKNLIAPEFPGPILKQFSNMILSQINNFERYNLRDSIPLIYLWMYGLLLLPDWNKDRNILYLMDIIVHEVSPYVYHDITLRPMFQNLFSLTVEGNTEDKISERNLGTIGTFFNWATGSLNNFSLLGGTVQEVWIAFVILTIEQHNREESVPLWKNLLIILADQPKITVDAALKIACEKVRRPPFSSNALAIYRWMQQILDTPMDHPMLPLLWCKFFSLYMDRAPTFSGVGGMGEKFFEGMMNFNYLKKMKKRVRETHDYFRNKLENEIDNGELMDDNTRALYSKFVILYQGLAFVLDNSGYEDGDQSAYISKLDKNVPQILKNTFLKAEWISTTIMPWLEYYNFKKIETSDLASVAEWQRVCFRTPENQNQQQFQTTPGTLNSGDPLKRIFQRLTTYEQPISPPSLDKNVPVINSISRDNLYNSYSVISLVKPCLKIILDYAQTYNLLVSEHTAVDCTFLELVPTLYKETENTVTLHALCDPAPSNQRRSRSGTPPTVHCAGPAVIRIKVVEAHVNDGIDNMITQNRAEYENLLVKASQPPPSKVSQGCVFIDYIITLLEHELNLNRTNENSNVLRRVQESGLKLFYHLVEFYTEDAILCPPTKQLITTCLEKLGQLFISGEESQGPQLLRTILQRPNLGGLLGPHFTPVAGGASTFLQMYQTIVDLSTSANVDLCFVLLSKFDVGSWLNYRRPRLSERSTFIELVSKALCNIGLNPEEDKLMIHELFRNHLRLVLLHEFPEHYGEVLSAVLKGSENQNLSSDVWRDLLGALSGKPKNAVPPVHASKIRDEIRHYATEQRLLSRQEMHDTAVMLSRHFMRERLQYGLYGLYPRYRVYNEPLTTFLGMISHALVVLTLQSDRGSLADQLCEKIWPVLSEMYAPWIIPYWTRNLREPTAAWIQQLTDDRSVLLPWIIADGPYANKTVAMFTECIRFIMDTMPASNKILCFVWHFYVTNFAHASVKDYILNVIHGNFLILPWDRFWPGINDVELMIKVVDQYLSDSHLFLGSIFTCINWPAWINELQQSQPLPVVARMHICLLNLFVKLSNEPNVRQNEKTIQLLTEAEKFSWHLVDASAYDQVINWHVMSCDPRIVLCLDGDQCCPVDVAINNLLKIVGAFDATVTHFHPTTLKKRQMYVRSFVKLLINCTTKHKSLLSTNSKVFTKALSHMLDEMEAIILSTVPEAQQVSEAGLLVTELFHIINQSGVLIEHLRTSWTSWILQRTANNPILLGILRVIGMIVASSSVLGELMEAALEAYFKFNVTESIQPTWASVLTILQPVVPRQPPLESVLVSEGRLLALYSVLLKRLPSCQDIREEGMLLINLVDWITAIKPVDIGEGKLPLLWAKACELAYRQCQYSENAIIAARALKGLARALLTMADDVGQGWGILGAIGLRKSSQLSIKCKFLSRAIAVYCLAQLPESKSEQQLVRFTPHAAGVAPLRTSDSDAMETRPSVEAIKAMQTLEGLLSNKQYAELKTDIERSIRLIRDSSNSLHNAVNVVGTLTAELYNHRYLHVLSDQYIF